MRKGTIWIVTGFLMITGALSLSAYNYIDDARAGESAQATLADLSKRIGREAGADAESDVENVPKADESAESGSGPGDSVESDEEKRADFGNPDRKDYAGILYMPTLELELPVCNRYTKGNLRVGPCLYAGSCEDRNLVICAHNFRSHFGLIGDMHIDDPVKFTDLDGKIYSYRVVEIEVLEADQIEEMVASDAELTLFTCTIGGKKRVTVRCEVV